jgi:uncharacterized protein YggE
MKKLFIIAALLTFSMAAFAQNFDLRKKIEVTGSAEAEVTPDIIYFGITLKEYLDGKNKVSIDQLEKQLQKAVNEAGITKEDFTINNISSYNWSEKKKDPGFLASKQYRIKFKDLSKINQILGKVDAKGIKNTNIEGYDYSGIESLKKELKLKALVAAKEKATFLLVGIGEKIGGAIDVQEINNEIFPQQVYRANVMMMKAGDAEAESVAEEDIDFKKIKLNYQMRAVFEILP